MMYLMMMKMFVFFFLDGRKNLVCQEHKKSADENSEYEGNYMLKRKFEEEELLLIKVALMDILQLSPRGFELGPLEAYN
jgi:hypothetical protein